MKNSKIQINISELSYKKIALFASALFIVFIIVFTLLSGDDKETSNTKIEDSYVSATIVKVTDGDTIWVEIDGYKKKVRLIGINCPENNYYNNDANNWGKLATGYTQSKLTLGQTIYLQQDVSDTDSYGRLLRYVWLEKPKDNTNKEEIQNKMLNAMILLNGYANAKEYAPDILYSKVFQALESVAKENQTGLWQP